MAETHIQNYANLSAEELDSSVIPDQLARGIDSKEYSLRDIVILLGDQLLSDEQSSRGRAVDLLAEILNNSPILDRQSTKTLTTFFCSKLSDAPTIDAAVKGLTRLIPFSTFGVGESMEVGKALISLDPLSVHPQATRYLFYVLLDALMAHGRTGLKRIDTDGRFVKGYCALVEGEKDPRNLVLSFGIVQVILLEFDIAGAVDDLFDITFCYFPITFTPPPDDPYGISAEDLIISLRDCLVSTPLFGPLALPLFLDKLQAVSERSKQQTIRALIASFPIYGAGVVGEWAAKFSEALTIEMYHSTDNMTVSLASEAITSLYSTLYPDLLTKNQDSMDVEVKPIEGVAVKLVQNCLEELAEADKTNAAVAVKISLALLKASKRLQEYTIDKTFSLLLELLADGDCISLRPAIISHISTFLGALSHPFSSEPSTALISRKDDILTRLVSAVTGDEPTQIPAISALVNLLLLTNLYNQEERLFGLNSLNEIVQNSTSSIEVYNAAISGLVLLSERTQFTNLIETTTVPILVGTLPQSNAPDRNSTESHVYRNSLESLADICLSRELCDVLIRRLFSRLQTVCSLPSMEDHASSNMLYAHHLLITIGAVLSVKAGRGDSDIPDYEQSLLPKLFGLFITSAIERDKVGSDERLMADAGVIVGTIIRVLPESSQRSLGESLSLAFFHGQLEHLLDEYPVTESSDKFEPFKASSSTTQQSTITLFSSAILVMRASVKCITMENILDFITLSTRVTDHNEIQRKISCWIVGQTFNKHLDTCEPLLTTEVPQFWKNWVMNEDQNLNSRKNALVMFTWITKALIVRAHVKGYEGVSLILSLFTHPLLGKDAAKSIGILTEESDRVLSKENYAQVLLFYKQRFFAFLLPKIVAGHKQSTTEEHRTVYLIALSSLLGHIPKSIALVELPKLLPLLTTALDLPDAGLRTNVIETLAVLAKESSVELTSSISTLVVKILCAISKDPVAQNSTKLRIASLVFVGLLPRHIPYMTLHPQKVFVLKELGKLLDDKKREVRKVAVTSRGAWFAYTG